MQTAANQQQEMVQTYCVTCHSTRARRAAWRRRTEPRRPRRTTRRSGKRRCASCADIRCRRRAVRSRRSRMWIRSSPGWKTRSTPHAKGPKAGYVPIQRLNRTEYAASVKALVGVDVKAKEVLPQDIQVEGFDNIAAALSVSPAFLDQYVTAARQVARLAVGNPNPRVSSVKYPIDGQPESRRSSASRHARRHQVQTQLPRRRRVSHHHQRPCGGPIQRCAGDAEHTGHPDRWQDRVSQVDRRTGGSGSGRSQGGRPDARRSWTRFAKIPVQVKAGVRDVVVAFIDRSHVETDENLERLQPYGGLTGSQAPVDRRPVWSTASRSPGRSTHRHFDNAQPRPDLRLRSQDRRANRPAPDRSRRIWRAAHSGGRSPPEDMNRLDAVL